MVGLAAVEPDGLGVVDEDVVDGCFGLHAGDGDEARFEARARGRDEGGVGECDRHAGGGEGGFCYCVVLEDVSDGWMESG